MFLCFLITTRITKACEVFILELTLRAWGNVEAAKRHTLLKSDVVKGCHQTDMYDFLVDIVPPRNADVMLELDQPLQHSLREVNQNDAVLLTNPNSTTNAGQMSLSFYPQQCTKNNFKKV